MELTCLPYEYFGLTECNRPPEVVVLSSGNALPEAIDVTSGELGTDCNSAGEALEGMLVTMRDVTLSSEANLYGEVAIDDGSGQSQMNDAFFDVNAHLARELADRSVQQLTGAKLTKLTGIVRFAYASFEIVPRDTDDLALLGGDQDDDGI